MIILVFRTNMLTNINSVAVTVVVPKKTALINGLLVPFCNSDIPNGGGKVQQHVCTCKPASPNHRRTF